jgi:hypothetical protein
MVDFSIHHEVLSLPNRHPFEMGGQAEESNTEAGIFDLFSDQVRIYIGIFPEGEHEFGTFQIRIDLLYERQAFEVLVHRPGAHRACQSACLKACMVYLADGDRSGK